MCQCTRRAAATWYKHGKNTNIHHMWALWGSVCDISQHLVACKRHGFPILHRIYKNLQKFTPLFAQFMKIYVIYSIIWICPPPPPSNRLGAQQKTPPVASGEAPRSAPMRASVFWVAHHFRRWRPNLASIYLSLPLSMYYTSCRLPLGFMRYQVRNNDFKDRACTSTN